MSALVNYGAVFMLMQVENQIFDLSLIPQALMMLMVEKVSVFFPRMCQKLERFYKSVVEEALLGKYPDVAEDFTSGAAHQQFHLMI